MKAILRTLLIISTLALWGGHLAAQTRLLKGTVLDNEGQPLIGAGIAETGTKNGVVTDLDGNFEIKIPAGRNVMLKVMSLGMVPKDVVITPRQETITVKLEADTELDAAVINAGYGVVQRRENFTGSAFQVNHDDLVLKPAARLDNLLAGQVPGLNVIEETTSGRPSVKIRIRGDGSLSASNEPLWVIDGVPIYTGSKTNTVTGVYNTVSPLSYMNPDDIESMTVLKDASTTALYGADGANGVILVTTRSAAIGKTSYNASVKYGISSVDRTTLPKYTNAAQWRELAMEGWVNSGRPAAAFPYRDNEHNSYSTTDTDWYSMYFGIGHTAQINFSATGGTEHMRNYFSLEYFRNESTTIGNNQDRYALRNKTTLIFTDKFRMDSSFGVSYNHSDIFSVSSSYNEVLPIFDPYLPDGSYRLYNYYSRSDTDYVEEARKFFDNDLPEREYCENYQNTISADVNLMLTYEPVKGLKFTSQTGFSNV
ncbi:MAG: TonB-dependent receptor plug domain-containing protein [Bacteroidales bacterium]|nr:TonB-dependent receptor plug domain-containing protein [Bacteroidales bacterium]